MTVTVVHCKRAPYTVYIGRPGPFGNPFPIGPRLDRSYVLWRFETYARNSPSLMQAIRELPESAVLGCWCHPLPCHGDVIVKLWKEMHSTNAHATT